MFVVSESQISKEGGSVLLTKFEIKSLDIIERHHRWWYGAHRFTVSIQPGNNVNNDDDQKQEDKLVQVYR